MLLNNSSLVKMVLRPTQGYLTSSCDTAVTGIMCHHLPRRPTALLMGWKEPATLAPKQTRNQEASSALTGREHPHFTSQPPLLICVHLPPGLRNAIRGGNIKKKHSLLAGLPRLSWHTELRGFSSPRLSSLRTVLLARDPLCGQVGLLWTCHC